jgi:hypothetical protein
MGDEQHDLRLPVGAIVTGCFSNPSPTSVGAVADRRIVPVG